jgi:hypothetical protein
MADQQLGLLRRMAELLGTRSRMSELREVEKQITALRQDGAQELPL